MRTRRAHADMRAFLALRAPGGGPVQVTAASLAYHSRAGTVVEARLTFLVPAERYCEVDARALFHLARDARGPGAERFVPEGNVQIEARLGGALLPVLVALGDAPERAAEALVRLNEGQPDHALFAAASWYALHVTCEEETPRGTLRTGYSTTWTARETP